MTYNVFGWTLSLTQSINHSPVHKLSSSEDFYGHHCLTLSFEPMTLET